MKDKILDNLAPILISLLAFITVIPVLLYGIEDNIAPSFFIDLVSIFITLFWMLFFVVYGISVLIKETKKDRSAYKESARNLKFSFLSVLFIVVGSFLFKENELDNYNEMKKEERYLIIKEEEKQNHNVFDSLKNFKNRDSLISTYYFNIGEEFVLFGFYKEGFNNFDTALYYHKSSHYYSKIAYHLKYSLNNKEKALEYEKKAYALDTSRKYLLNFIKDLENEINAEKD